jgi:AcrR family transcriptional regulator
VDARIVEAAIAEVRETGKPLADLSMDRIARRAGLSRSTFFRKVRARRELEAAVREAGVDPGHRPRVRHRAIAAAVELIVSEGVGALTVEEVARRAGCAITSVHTQFGGREGLLGAVLEAYAPLPAVERALAGDPGRFDDAVRAVYAGLFEAMETDIGVIEAFLAESLARPNGLVMTLAQETLVPGIMGGLGAWLEVEIRAGKCRDLPLSLLLPLLIGPIGVHMMARRRMATRGLDVPSREEAIDAMTSAFCRAVGRAVEMQEGPGARG